MPLGSLAKSQTMCEGTTVMEADVSPRMSLPKVACFCEYFALLSAVRGTILLRVVRLQGPALAVPPPQFLHH